MKKEGGFALILFLALLPVVLAMAFALGAGSLMIGDRRAALNSCRKELLDGLRKASTPMRELLNLNPMATTLRLESQRLTAALASAAGNPAATAILTARLTQIQSQRIRLEAIQRKLFAQAASHLRTGQLSAGIALRSSAEWLKIRVNHSSPPRPAVRPVGPGPAPDWEKIPPFSDRQALEQTWQWSFEIKGVASRFLKSSYRREEKCGATLDDSWNAQLR